MGKRKKASKPMNTKRKETLPTVFQCLFCNHEKSVAVRMDKKAGVGTIQCKVCGQDWSTNINFLSAPVDVYADWVDACDEAAKTAAASGGGPIEPERPAYRNEPEAAMAKSRNPGGQQNSREMDGFIEDDEMDAEQDFGDDD